MFSVKFFRNISLLVHDALQKNSLSLFPFAPKLSLLFICLCKKKSNSFFVLKIQALQEIEKPQNKKIKKRKKKEEKENQRGNVKVGIFHLLFANTLCFPLLSLVGWWKLVGYGWRVHTKVAAPLFAALFILKPFLCA